MRSGSPHAPRSQSTAASFETDSCRWRGQARGW
jgi:hypothetical protein